jgi:hypothetical protein
MSKIPFEIIQLINTLDEKIPAEPRKLSDHKVMRSELCLWNMSATHEWAPTYYTIDHVHKMKIAYLAEGCNGIWKYVEKYVIPSQKARIKSVIMMGQKSA